MSTSSQSSRLELLRNRFPGWRIVRSEGRTIGYTATRGDERVWAAHLGALEAKLAEIQDEGTSR